ncbi:energy-coupling factor transporter ATPase [Hujiaoplasma nucleasis]|uniref:Energy-coupling factor transporter ATP-binding protein EcfA2 n=1 Tax=Hujiaoplasma nucleasis TaxID=2725268 RepID=A0A7L6N249_9MOLU|nr:energy-coupling factor transporter ATPase [Hujiaoplasma nucleasis]QLY40336.1 energy-coupling factor transporter ATPase [Hujiaoplasma nucleasis]
MGIRFNEVTHQYSSFSKISASAIYKISLEIQDTGEFIALVGHTGSGKTTLAKHMNALIFPTEGEVEIFGKKITSKRNKKISYNSIRQKVGLVFQFPEYQLFEETVLKDVMFGPLNFHIEKEKAEKLAKDALRLVGLDESYYNRNPYNLSGGEKKRASIAGILAMDPQILVLDEPTSGLDPHGKKVLMELFLSIHKQTNKSIIVITHDMDLLYQYFKRTIVMNDGEKIFDGSPEDLFRDHALVEKYLDYPHSIKVMKHLNQVHGLDMDIYKKSVDEITDEIKKAVKS